jgi:site-specific DNA recombinase
MIEAYGYTRVSSEKQTKGHGPERQTDLIDSFARQNGYRLVYPLYSDAHTGTEADRPQFMEMLGAMMDNGIKTCIVESLDRLARDLMVQSTLLAKLSAEGLTLIAANTGENVTEAMQSDPMRKAMVQIQGVFAELDKSMLVRKLRKGRDAVRKEKGRCEGRKPFGHYDGEQDTLDRLVTLRQPGENGKRMSYRKIADQLNSEGLVNRTGTRWTEANVKKVLETQAKQKPARRRGG